MKEHRRSKDNHEDVHDAWEDVRERTEFPAREDHRTGALHSIEETEQHYVFQVSYP